MKLEPKPTNEFREFCHAYYESCRSRFDRICAVAAKWDFEDLIPGLSDFDTRFIVEGPMDASEWEKMSLAVGEVHTDLARRFPRWARILEHLPGLNLTVDEILDERLFYPEFRQWTFYEGDEEVIDRIRSYLECVEWSAQEELYHLKKVAIFFGPYQRGIDPPINLGPWESKYALHSRYMHYFTPAVQAMVSLQLKRTVRGKFEALRLAKDVFPSPHVVERLEQCVRDHYEWDDFYREPALTQLEHELDSYLCQAWLSLNGHLTLIDPDPADSREAIATQVGSIPENDVQKFFEVTRFSRLMKGRLLFYTSSIPWFDVSWLIRNEVGRMPMNLYHQPLTIYGRVRFGQDLSAEDVLARMTGRLISTTDAQALRTFADTADVPIKPGEERDMARRVADVYSSVLKNIEKIGREILDTHPLRCSST